VSRIAVRHRMVTRAATTNAVRKAVLETNELLEAVLSQLPMQNLLLVRRVCKAWNALILTSPRILRKLFLAPERDTKEWIINRETRVVMQYSESNIKRYGRQGSDRQGSIITGKLNPLLLTGETDEVKNAMTHEQRYERCETLTLTCRPNLRLLGLPNRLVHRMYVCQPPCIKFDMYIEYYQAKPRRKVPSFWSPPKKVRVLVENAKGVTFADVLRGMLFEDHPFSRRRYTDFCSCAGFLDAVGPGTATLPSTKYAIRKGRSSLWCIGVIFPSQEEIATVETTASHDSEKMVEEGVVCGFMEEPESLQ